MILSKQYLNEQVQKRFIKDNFQYDGLFCGRRQELTEYDVFISYSWNDRTYADKIVQLLEKCGYSVYIDYNDKHLNRNNISESTAKRIVEEMKKCKGLLYLYSPSSSVSKWCPWEVGIFSGMKNFRCANLPLVDKSNDDFKKQEYLELYPYIDYEKVEGKDYYDFWVCESEHKYVLLRDWIIGQKPYVH